MGLLFSLLRARRRGISLLGWLLTSGLGAALLNTIVARFHDRSLQRRWPLASHEVEEALGEERIQWLIKRTGMTRGDLLAGLRFPLEEEHVRF